MPDRITQIRAKLQQAKHLRLGPFGSDRHQLRLQPVADEDVISKFELSLGITLPDEYRAFIKQLGDGGAGPAYGLLPLRSALDYDVESKDWGRFQKAFPYTDFHDAMDMLDPTTDESLPRTGSITICDEGCYHRHFIVIKGPTRGQIWIDGRSSDGGFFPLNVGFFDWYEHWLDDVLAGGSGTWWLQKQG